MTKLTMRKMFLITGLLAFAVVGCSGLYTKTPTSVNASTGQTNFEYTISPGTSNFFREAQNGIQSVPTFGSDTVGIAKDAALGLLALVSSALGVYGRIKSSQANTQTQAADMLAAHVVKSGQSTAALQTASGSPAFSAVAAHIDNNTL